MKKNILTYSFLAVILSLILSACKKQVQIDPPITTIAPVTVFNNDNTAISAELNIYAAMAEDPLIYHHITGLSSDEYMNYSNNSTYQDLYKNSLQGQGIEPADIGIWSTSYNYLYRVNAVLEGLENSKNLSETVKEQTQGEALFMRAYFDFYLTNFYGDIAIVNGTDFKVNQSLARSPQSFAYKQVIKDLRQAQVILSANYLDATDLAVTTERIRPTRWAATALLARAYLYNKNWSEADSAASVLIGNSSYQLSPLTGSSSVFVKNSSEAIWQITPDLEINPNATPEGNFSVLTTAPGTGQNVNGVTVSAQLLRAFEPNDQRKNNWIGSFTDGVNTYYFPNKYKDGQNAISLNEYTMILRLGEQYLIRAEARAMNNNPAGAISDLNVIRTRAGLPNYNGPTDNGSLLTAILHERQIELFSEGHRWFDLRRTGSLDAVMGPPGNVTISKGGTVWKSYQQYYPIPQSDIQVSPNLKQTFGY